VETIRDGNILALSLINARMDPSTAIRRIPSRKRIMKGKSDGAKKSAVSVVPMLSTVKAMQRTCMNPKCRNPLDPREARLVSWKGKLFFFCSEVEAVRALQRFQSSPNPCASGSSDGATTPARVPHHSADESRESGEP